MTRNPSSGTQVYHFVEMTLPNITFFSITSGYYLPPTSPIYNLQSILMRSTSPLTLYKWPSQIFRSQTILTTTSGDFPPKEVIYQTHNPSWGRLSLWLSKDYSPNIYFATKQFSLLLLWYFPPKEIFHKTHKPSRSRFSPWFLKTALPNISKASRFLYHFWICLPKRSPLVYMTNNLSYGGLVFKFSRDDPPKYLTSQLFFSSSACGHTQRTIL